MNYYSYKQRRCWSPLGSAPAAALLFISFHVLNPVNSAGIFLIISTKNTFEFNNRRNTDAYHNKDCPFIFGIRHIMDDISN
jgi:hypothetical protein